MPVEDDHIGSEPIERLEAGLGGTGALHCVADPVEVVAHGAQLIGVVIDQQDAVSHGATHRAARWLDPR